MAAAFGFKPTDYEQATPLWPENVRAVNLFADLSTQWRVGPGGVVGLDYNVLLHELDRMGLEKDEYDELLDDIRAMEVAALEEMRRE